MHLASHFEISNFQKDFSLYIINNTDLKLVFQWRGPVDVRTLIPSRSFIVVRGDKIQICLEVLGCAYD